MFRQQVTLVWTNQHVNMLLYFLHVVSSGVSLRFQVVRCMQLVDEEMNSKQVLLVLFSFWFS